MAKKDKKEQTKQANDLMDRPELNPKKVSPQRQKFLDLVEKIRARKRQRNEQTGD
jgi:hypothetical protein